MLGKHWKRDVYSFLKVKGPMMSGKCISNYLEPSGVSQTLLHVIICYKNPDAHISPDTS